MAGVLPLSGLQIGVEGTKGNAVTTTRELYPDPTGYFDPGLGLSFHEGAQRGTFTNITHATLLNNTPTVGFRTESSHGITFDELSIVGSQLLAGATGVGGAADKTWTFTPSQTAPTFNSYTLNCFDASQAYEIAYCFATSFTLSGGFDDLTQASIDFVGREASKVTIDTVAANNSVKIPSALWTVKYASAQSGLTAASVLSNTLRTWELSVQPPQTPRFYADGNKYFGQGVASRNLAGTLTMTWDSTSDAVAQYDLYAAQTPAFFRLKATGPTLGGSAYSAQIDCCVIWESVQPLASESDSVMEYQMTGRLAYDATWTNSLVMTVVNSIAALP